MFVSTLRQAATTLGRRRAVAATSQIRSLADGPKLPFGLDKILGEPDNLIPTDAERKTKTGHIPDFATPEIKKDLEELGLTGVEDLDEMEEKNMDGYNELGLVPPEGAGSYASPILIPSRMDSRVVGYEDPTTHAVFWFTIHNDENTYYIKDLGLFFKMLHIPDEAAASAH
mmetsp:Transcript_1339/g.943  ORF Transcript_1339/g.943 Transcript_1339/m.943 type:complete len:171 (-) Transcript_1339:500-1012(-)